MSTIQVEHISKNFGSQRAVDDVSFEVEQGEIFQLLGANGRGKTTTIRIILDLFKPIRQGEPVGRCNDRRQEEPDWLHA